MHRLAFRWLLCITHSPDYDQWRWRVSRWSAVLLFSRCRVQYPTSAPLVPVIFLIFVISVSVPVLTSRAYVLVKKQFAIFHYYTKPGNPTTGHNNRSSVRNYEGCHSYNSLYIIIHWNMRGIRVCGISLPCHQIYKDFHCWALRDCVCTKEVLVILHSVPLNVLIWHMTAVE